MCKNYDVMIRLKKQLNEHHLQADRSYKNKEDDKFLTKDHSKTKTITFGF